MGFVMLLEGWALPPALQGLDPGLGFFGFIMWMESFPAGLALVVLGAAIQATEVGRRPIRAVLVLAAIVLACTGSAVLASQPPASRFVGPGRLQTVARYGEMTMLLVGVLASVVSAGAGSGRNETAGTRGLRLGRTTLRVGAVLLVAGLVLPALVFVRHVPAMLLVASFKLTPILIAAGVVLLPSSAVAIRRVASHPPRFLTLGQAALGTGLVLLLLGCSAFLCAYRVGAVGWSSLGPSSGSTAFPRGWPCSSSAR